MEAAHDVKRASSDDNSAIEPARPAVARQHDVMEPGSSSSASNTGARLIFALLKSQRRLLFLATTLAIFAAAAELAPYWLVYRMAVEVVSPPTPDTTQRLVLFAVLILAIAVVRLVLAGGAHIAAHAAAFQLQRDLRAALVRKLRHLPLGVVEGKTGAVKKTVIDDVAAIETLVAHAVPDAVTGVAVPLIGAAILFAVDWRMALASLALLPVAALAQRRLFRDIGPMFARWHAAENVANTSFLAYVQGIATLKAYNRAASSLSELRESVQSLARLAGDIARGTAVPHALFFVSLANNLLVVLPFGLVLHAHGSLDVPSFVLFAILGAGLTAPLLRLIFAFAALQRQTQGADRIADILHAPEQQEPARPLSPQRTDIAFGSVRFGYDERDVIHDLSLTVPEARVTALVGPSGAGKSTLVRLIARFWNVRAGTVRIGGVDVREIAPERLHALVAVVFQDPFFFHGTVRENLVLAAPDAPASAMESAVAAAGLADLMARLPRGLDTPIGDRGSRLSGGERQRLAIARALLKDAPILLLDEATAFADPENELSIQQAIARLTAGRTVVVVAHRLATVVQADQIAVLVRGRLDAVGRHDDVLRTSGTYRRLWDAQQRARGWTLRPQATGEARP
jgi:ATP-binding cassette, subfamily B, bacterial IrtA/YbtP